MAIKKTGRPEKAPEDTRQERIAFRVTLDERLRIETAAAAAGASVSDYVRAVSLTSKPPRPRRTRDSVNAPAISELNRVGVNLWQITKHLNFGGSIPPDLHEAIEEVRAAVAKLAGGDD
ncbi:plasmid mobilization protein [Paracoccus sp. Ld10]|uniref:plasmid mobilization protein n=1 Tax=Paracoccus sp. Ld10 TaxID=649158 RepID=UPI0038648DF7